MNLFTRTDTRAEVLEGDCLDRLREMEDESVHAVVTDPPAGISFMGAEWDSNKGSRNNWIAWLTEVMKEVLRVTKPGGHALVWALPRTSHWTAMALEDAGWEVRDRITHHFGSGFPKSASVSKQIDKMAGAEREKIGQGKGRTGPAAQPHGGSVHSDDNYQWPGDFDITAPATDEARKWDGFGTALKPSTEDWWLCRKPLSESSIARNVLEHSTGALNIDGCRVAHQTVGNGNLAQNTHLRPNVKRGKGESKFGMGKTEGSYEIPSGRWPANLILSHHPDCQRVGEKRVKGSRIEKPCTSDDMKSGYHPGLNGHRPARGHGDPNGFERVAAYECHEGGTITVPSFSGKSGGLTPLDAPESLLGRLQNVLQDLPLYSKACSSLLPRAYESYRSEHKLWGASSDDLFYAVGRALGLSKFPDFRVCCQSCRRFCGERAQSLLEAAQASPQQLFDALVCVHSALSRHARNPSCQYDARLCNSGDSALLEMHGGTQKNKTDAPHCECRPADIRSLSRNGDTQPQQAQNEETHNSIPENNTWGCDDSFENPECIACSDVVSRLLASLALDLTRLILPSAIIQRNEIDINLPQCPCRILDEQSGVSKGGGHVTPHERNGAAGGGFTSRPAPQFDGYNDQGGSSRFFAQFHPDTGPGFRYQAKASKRDRTSNGAVENTHPTCKPTPLLRYLIRMITPPEGTVLDCFAGSGSTLVAAIHEGFDCVGIEAEPEYAEIARARVRHALENPEL